MQKLFHNRFIKITGLLVLVAVGYYFLLRHFAIEAQAAVFEAMGSGLLVMGIAFLLYRLQTFYHPRSAIDMTYFGIVGVSSLLITLFMQWYGGQFLAQYAHYHVLLGHLFFVRWFVLLLVLWAITYQFWIDHYAEEQQKILKRLVQQERELAKAEMHNLQQQFRPHFLFNSINSISALVKTQPQEAREMLIALSDLLRMTLQKSDTEFIRLADEINYLKLYMAMEKMRFGPRLSLHINNAEPCADKRLPALILQPLLENAIKFGGDSQTNVNSIYIIFDCTADELRITIENTYDPETIKMEKGTGFGLKSIERKLNLLYKQSPLLQVQKTADMFKVRLKIPQER